MKKQTTYSLVALLLALMFGLSFFSMLGNALTMDELAHVPAGYSYIVKQDMRLNPEHPPLLKDLAGFSVWLGSKITNTPISFPEQSYAWQNKLNGQWEFGRQFLFQSDNPTDKIIFWSHLPMLMIMLILGIYVFRWSKDIYGEKAGLIALFFYALSPSLIGHGSLVATDVGAAAAFIIASYYLVKWLQKPSSKNLILAGLVFGLALLTKFSLALIIPYFIALTLLWAIFSATQLKTYSLKNKILFQEKKTKKTNQHVFKKIFKNNFRYFSGLLLIGLIGLILIWPVYVFHTFNYPPERQIQDTQEYLATYGNRLFADPVLWMSENSFLRPFGYYFTGLLMVMQREAGGNTTYFLGQINNQAWPEYFPVVFALKIPLALLILGCLALIYAAGRIKKPLLEKLFLRINHWIRKHFSELALLLLFALYWYVSITSNLNIGLRHIFPTFPILYILISGKISQWLETNKGPKLEKIKLDSKKNLTSVQLITQDHFKSILKYSLIILLLAWYGWGTIKAYPHFISYFNELAGGSEKGYLYVTDSNLDWGQDLKRLAEYVKENNIQTIYLDYFGGDSPEYRLNKKVKPWWGERDPNDLPDNAWLAVSATFLQGGRSAPVPGFNYHGHFYSWLNQYQPKKIIGHSIFVYQIP